MTSSELCEERSDVLLRAWGEEVLFSVCLPGEPGRPPATVRYALMHRDYGVALLDLAPDEWPDAAERLRRRYHALYPGTPALPVVYRSLASTDLWRLTVILDSAFTLEPPPAKDDPDWMERARGALAQVPEPPAPQMPARTEAVQAGTPAGSPEATSRDEPPPTDPGRPRHRSLLWPVLIAGPILLAAAWTWQGPGTSVPVLETASHRDVPERSPAPEMHLPAQPGSGSRGIVAETMPAPPPLLLDDRSAGMDAALAASATVPDIAEPPAAPAFASSRPALPPMEPAPPRSAAPPAELVAPALEPSQPPPTTDGGSAAATLPLLSPVEAPLPALAAIRPPPEARIAGPQVAALPVPPLPEPAAPGPVAETGPASLLPTLAPPSPPEEVVRAGTPVEEAVRPATHAEPGPSSRPDPALLQALLRRGNALFALGDVSAARLFYERAAAAGSGPAAVALARTYDPAVLDRLGVRGLRPDREAAAAWYRRAAALGENEAVALLQHLEARGTAR